MTSDGATPRAQLIITITADGKPEVTGPLHDKFACYALLEVARDVIKDHTDALAKSQIVRATPSDVPNLKLS